MFADANRTPAISATTHHVVNICSYARSPYNASGLRSITHDAREPKNEALGLARCVSSGVTLGLKVMGVRQYLQTRSSTCMLVVCMTC